MADNKATIIVKDKYGRPFVPKGKTVRGPARRRVGTLLTREMCEGRQNYNPNKPPMRALGPTNAAIAVASILSASRSFSIWFHKMEMTQRFDCACVGAVKNLPRPAVGVVICMGLALRQVSSQHMQHVRSDPLCVVATTERSSCLHPIHGRLRSPLHLSTER